MANFLDSQQKSGYYLQIKKVRKSFGEIMKAKGWISKRELQNEQFLPSDSTPTYVCVSGGKKCSFFGTFGVLCFLVTPVLRFVLLPYCRRFGERMNARHISEGLQNKPFQYKNKRHGFRISIEG